MVLDNRLRIMAEGSTACTEWKASVSQLKKELIKDGYEEEQAEKLALEKCPQPVNPYKEPLLAHEFWHTGFRDTLMGY